MTLSIPPLEPDPPKLLMAPSQAEWDRMLDVALEDGKVRFYDGDRRLLDPDERAEALQDALNDEQMLRQEAEQARRDAEGCAADEARARRDAEKRAADAAAELAQMRALLERLQRGG